MPISRRALLAGAPLLLCGCDPAPPTREANPSPSTIPTPSPSASPTPPPPTSAPPAQVNQYLDQVPKLDKPPMPEAVQVTDGQSTPWWFRVPTQHKVAFITIDDGGLARTSEALELIKRAAVPVTLFLNSPAAARHADYFRQIQATGAGIQNHTVTHRNLRGQSYHFQRKEIEDCSTKLEELFGTRPHLFRPPFGNYDNVTLKAARDCGMRVSFFWTQTVHEGIVRFQTAKKQIMPGDVLLMHFRPALARDLVAALKAIHHSGLTPARLEDYVPPRP